MGTKINRVRQQIPSTGIMLTSWLESHGLSRTEISASVESAWLERISTGVYKFVGDSPTIYGILSSYGKQCEMKYHIGAASALELKGFSHYVSMGKPKAVVFAPVRPSLPKWIENANLDMQLVSVSTKIFGEYGIEQMDYQGLPIMVSSPERAIMECLLLAPVHYNLMDVYYLFEMLTSLRASMVQRLLESCSSVKVKRLFLYMAEKSRHRWFEKLDISRINLGSGTRSFEKGGVKNAKYDIVIPKELAVYE